MRPEISISLAMLALLNERGGRDVGLRQDIVRKLQFLRSKNVRVPGIRITPGIEGPVSDEVSNFVGRLAIAGFSVQESPMKLTASGLHLLKERVSQKLTDPDVAESARIFGLTPEFLQETGTHAVPEAAAP